MLVLLCYALQMCVHVAQQQVIQILIVYTNALPWPHPIPAHIADDRDERNCLFDYTYMWKSPNIHLIPIISHTTSSMEEESQVTKDVSISIRWGGLNRCRGGYKEHMSSIWESREFITSF